MSIDAGKLRHRVRIERFTSELDSNGAVQESWTLWALVWAAVEPLSAREFIQSAQTQSSVVARITTRYRPGLLHTMRIVHRDRIYNIAGVLPDKVSGLEYVTLPVSEGVNAGQ